MNTEHYSAQIILFKFLTLPNENVNCNIVSAVRMAVKMTSDTPWNIHVSSLQMRWGVTVVGKTFNRERRPAHFRLYIMTSSMHDVSSTDKAV